MRLLIAAWIKITRGKHTISLWTQSTWFEPGWLVRPNDSMYHPQISYGCCSTNWAKLEHSVGKRRGMGWQQKLLRESEQKTWLSPIVNDKYETWLLTTSVRMMDAWLLVPRTIRVNAVTHEGDQQNNRWGWLVYSSHDDDLIPDRYYKATGKNCHWSKVLKWITKHR